MTKWILMASAIVLVLYGKDDFHPMLIMFLVLAFVGMVSWMFLRWVYGGNNTSEGAMKEQEEKKQPDGPEPMPIEDRYVLPLENAALKTQYPGPAARSFEESWMTTAPWVQAHLPKKEEKAEDDGPKEIKATRLLVEYDDGTAEVLAGPGAEVAWNFILSSQTLNCIHGAKYTGPPMQRMPIEDARKLL